METDFSMIQQDLIWQQMGFMLQAAQMGIICGILYDVLRLPRYRHGRICEFFLDVLFSCIASGMIFVLVIGMTQSRLRIFLLAAFGIGWLLWYITLGRFLRGIAKKLR